jgi:hypothetical protein
MFRFAILIVLLSPLASAQSEISGALYSVGAYPVELSGFWSFLVEREGELPLLGAESW